MKNIKIIVAVVNIATMQFIVSKKIKEAIDYIQIIYYVKSLIKIHGQCQYHPNVNMYYIEYRYL